MTASFTPAKVVKFSNLQHLYNNEGLELLPQFFRGMARFEERGIYVQAAFVDGND